MAATKLMGFIVLNMLFGSRMVLSRALSRSLNDFINPEGTSGPRYNHSFHLRDKTPESPAETNVTYQTSREDSRVPFVIPHRLHRRALMEPAPATDSESAASATKGCSMLYMLAANAEDALTRLKTNPKLSKLSTSQSQWDKAGDLKQFGWTEKEDPVNWAYLGVDDVMRDLSIDTASRDNVNGRLTQDTAVEAEGMKFVVSLPLSEPQRSQVVGLHIIDHCFQKGFKRNL